MTRAAELKAAARLCSYEQCKAIAAGLETASRAATSALVTIPGHGSGPMGLTPDCVRARPDWQAARAASLAAFAALRAFNSIYAKRFAKEIRADIITAREAKAAARREATQPLTDGVQNV